jgi:hypothetical protein
MAKDPSMTKLPPMSSKESVDCRSSSTCRLSAKGSFDAQVNDPGGAVFGSSTEAQYDGRLFDALRAADGVGGDIGVNGASLPDPNELSEVREAGSLREEK